MTRHDSWVLVLQNLQRVNNPILWLRGLKDTTWINLYNAGIRWQDTLMSQFKSSYGYMESQWFCYCTSVASKFGHAKGPRFKIIKTSLHHCSTSYTSLKGVTVKGGWHDQQYHPPKCFQTTLILVQKLLYVIFFWLLWWKLAWVFQILLGKSMEMLLEIRKHGHLTNKAINNISTIII